MRTHHTYIFRKPNTVIFDWTSEHFKRLNDEYTQLTMEPDEISADGLTGISTVQQRVEKRIYNEVESHNHLDANSLRIITMYVVGSLGAGEGQKGSDLDLVVMLDYNGDASGQFDWLEYIQHDIEGVMKQNRTVLASALPDYIGYVDIKLGDQYDCEAFVRNMSQHGDYNRVFDLYDEASMDATRF